MTAPARRGIAQFVVKIARSHHVYRLLWLWRIDQSFQNSPTPLLESLIACISFLGSSTHSKASTI
jgi:hypothetical protein